MSQTIAIVGIDVELPGSPTFGAATATVLAGRYSTGRFPGTRLHDASIAAPPEDHYEGSYFDRIDLFDHRYFRVPARIAAMMDPFQRACLRSSVSAVNDAGLLGALNGSRTGVYASCNVGQQRLYEWLQRGHGTAPDLMSILHSSIAARVSYFLDLRGPATMVDTACSSSLYAVTLACADLASGVVDTAIVTSANLYLDPGPRGTAAIDVVSERGLTRAFDLGADGTSVGEGVVTVVLRRACDASGVCEGVGASGVCEGAGGADAPTGRYGTIHGWASGQDGRTATMAAPNPLAQTAVIERAWHAAGVDPAQLSLMVSHGTGTQVGDGIELDALTRAEVFQARRRGSVPLISTKANFGHLDVASGLLSLCLAAAATGAGRVPGHPTFVAPGLDLDLADSPFFIPSTATPVPRQGLAGVSSFGLTGTNVHVVVRGGDRGAGEASAALPLDLRRYWYPVDRNTFAKGDETVVEAMGVRSVLFRIEPFRDWEIAEHRVHGTPLMVGTSIVEILSRLLAGSRIDLRSFDVVDLDILRPLTAATARLEILAAVNLESLNGELSSRESDDTFAPWVRFALRPAVGTAPLTPRPPDGEHLIDVPVETIVGDGSVVSVSARWEVVDSLRRSESGDRGVLLLTPPAAHTSEYPRYHFYPSLLDAAINGMNAVFGDGAALLPWCCDRMTFHQDHLRGKRFTANIVRRSLVRDPRGNVVASLDVDLWDEYDEAVLSLRGYHVKNRVADSELRPTFHRVAFVDDLRRRGGRPPRSAVIVPDGTDVRGWATFDRVAMTWSEACERGDFGAATEVTVVGVPAEGTVAGRAWALASLLLHLHQASQVRTVTLLAPGALTTGAAADPVARACAAAGYSMRTELRFDVAVLDAPLARASVDLLEDFGASGLLRSDGSGAPRRARFEEIAVDPGAGSGAGARWQRDTDRTVLVVGASSGIGRAYAEYLADRYPSMRVVGCGRRAMPDRETRFEYLRADITSGAEVRRLASDVGQPQTIVTFAGQPADGLFIGKDPERFADGMRSKTTGSDLLVSAFPDAGQIVLIASVAGHVGAMGQAEYAAANAYQFGLAARQDLAGPRVRCLGLGAWAEIGMARDLADDVFVKTPPGLGVPLVHAFVMSDEPEASLFRVTGGARSYSTLFEPAGTTARPVATTTTTADDVDDVDDAAGGQARRGSKAAGSDVTERVLSAWTRVLGVDEYEYDVGFFEYGGDSISVVQLCHELNEEFPGVFDVTTLFAASTINAQARCVTASLGTPTPVSTEFIDIQDIHALFTSGGVKGVVD